MRGVPGVPDGWARPLRYFEEAPEIWEAYLETLELWLESNHFNVRVVP